METHDLEFMYQGGDTYHFMNTENYDQLEMDDEMLGDNAQWMQPGMKIQAEYYDGRPIGIKLPNSLVLEIVDTAPVMKTATKNVVDEAGEARERRDDQRAGVRRNGRQGQGESDDRRVSGAREVSSSVAQAFSRLIEDARLPLQCKSLCRQGG